MTASTKTLIILRHGKAAPHDAYPTDHARPLVARGHAEAEFIGRHLNDHGPRPGLIVSSPVLRALTTAQVVAKHVGCPLTTDKRLITDVRPSTVLPLIESALERHACAMIAGHNPTLSELLADLLKSDQPGRGDLHTGEAAILGFDARVANGCATLIDRVRLAAEPH